MSNIKAPEPQDMSVYSTVSLNQTLRDVRGRYGNFSFGTVENICKQYGIKYEKIGDGYKFSAPKLRLQIFIEKLHFSQTKYSRKPFIKR